MSLLICGLITISKLILEIILLVTQEKELNKLEFLADKLKETDECYVNERRHN